MLHCMYQSFPNVKFYQLIDWSMSVWGSVTFSIVLYLWVLLAMIFSYSISALIIYIRIWYLHACIFINIALIYSQISSKRTIMTTLTARLINDNLNIIWQNIPFLTLRSSNDDIIYKNKKQWIHTLKKLINNTNNVHMCAQLLDVFFECVSQGLQHVKLRGYDRIHRWRNMVLVSVRGGTTQGEEAAKCFHWLFVRANGFGHV